MVNVLVGVSAIAVCSLIGLKYSEKYALRKRFYSDWLTFNERLRCEIRCMRKSLAEISKELPNTDFYRLVKGVYGGESDGETAAPYLAADENAELTDYFGVLGKSDGASQLVFLEGYGEKIQTNLKKADEEEKKRRGLCFKLGLFAGLFVFVIVI